MSFFSKATPAPVPKTRNAWLAGLLLAGFFVLMVVGQLFTFEDFPAALAAFQLFGESLAVIYAGIIVVLEVLALPFLLGLSLSRAMRAVSMICGWLVIVFWLVVSIFGTIANVSNSGLLGATVTLPAGWWGVCFCVALGVLAVWAAWGSWPLTRKK
jgi:hypothetical protein